MTQTRVNQVLPSETSTQEGGDKIPPFQNVDKLCALLSDPSPIIGYACQWLPNSLTHWLTHCCLVNLIDVTLACEDTNSKLVDIVTVANVDDEDCIGNSLLQIW